VPLGAVLPLTFLVLIALVRRQSQLCDSRALWRVFDLGVFAEIAKQSNFVNAFSCYESSLNRRQRSGFSGRISTNISALHWPVAKFRAVSFELEQIAIIAAADMQHMEWNEWGSEPGGSLPEYAECASKASKMATWGNPCSS